MRKFRFAGMTGMIALFIGVVVPIFLSCSSSSLTPQQRRDLACSDRNTCYERAKYYNTQNDYSMALRLYARACDQGKDAACIEGAVLILKNDDSSRYDLARRMSLKVCQNSMSPLKTGGCIMVIHCKQKIWHNLGESTRRSQTTKLVNDTSFYFIRACAQPSDSDDRELCEHTIKNVDLVPLSLALTCRKAEWKQSCAILDQYGLDPDEILKD